ncbi:hypothetical protein DRN97_05455 [Methanosarcinales archaeon]|nr:MAG: hypothetical protein DRN97_05455 [Methanosarcinales archaeon]
MPTKVKVSFPLAEKTITVERDVGENENVIEAIDSLLSEIASLSKLEMKGRGRGLKHEMAAAGSGFELPGGRWVYQTQQPSAKFVDRYAKIVDEEEETEEKEVKNRQ